MTPSTRKEMYLNKIATGEGAVPTPTTREEMYLAKIAGEEVEVPTPATRVEMYLAKIAGEEVEVPTPATRLEMFLAAASGMPVSTPVPATREEILWDYIINGTNPQTITGVPPISFTGNGTPLIAWSMKGNGQQQGTPTPDNPVMPTFCGARTGNLVDFEAWLIRKNVPYTKEGNSYTITSLLNKLLTPYYFSDTDIYVSISGVMTIPTGSNIRIYIVKRDGTISGSVALGGNGNIRKMLNVLGAGIKFDYASMGTCTVDNLMLNAGSTALPYEPYGWAEKITCAGQTTPVYLGQTQTVRRIKKLIFTGDESWNYSTLGNNTRAYTPQIVECLSLSPAICTHFAYNVANVSYPRKGEFVINSSKAIIIGIDGSVFTDKTAWKTYLQQQYAAGTPVTVWYVLATPETAIVNEPLAKIGDYADELSSTDAGVSIPTVKGSNTLTVDTELQPSEVSITGYIAESQTMTAAKIMARANGMNVNDKELESLSKKELNSILKEMVKSDGRSTHSNG